MLQCFITLTLTLGRNSLSPTSLPSVTLSLEVSVPIAARESGDELVQRVRRPPSVLRCISSIDLHPLHCLLTNNFLCLLSTKIKFPSYICNSCAAKKDLEHTIQTVIQTVSCGYIWHLFLFFLSASLACLFHVILFCKVSSQSLTLCHLNLFV